ncbi:hypothetical protein QR680_005114 [Steinernema hermaphroditum]|uniref:7TM GPCR serpentine receptor class x (Srx) domain-containing protein n=1 Tax=Steinernema hermaphroditum TaxID=289476 RepID=A0AA39HT70_9BILA|nr:hypothetical protein QR680_005114 [Steinernema hermaphroditum]
MTFLPVAVGILNMYIIKKVTIFHNSFGAFWVSRTIGEIGSNIVHVVYSAPVTVFQPKDIYHPPPSPAPCTRAASSSFGPPSQSSCRSTS